MKRTLRAGIRMCLGVTIAVCLAVCLAPSTPAQPPMLRIGAVPIDSLKTLAWVSLAADPAGDTLQQRLPDAKELSYAIDPASGVLWFRMQLHAPAPERWFGINVAFDDDEIPDNGIAWWGSNPAKFDRLASAYLFKAHDDWQGYFGVADSASVARDLGSQTRAIKVAVDPQARAILLGVPRSALGAKQTVRVMATVGSMVANNDDVPNEGMISIRLAGE